MPRKRTASQAVVFLDVVSGGGGRRTQIVLLWGTRCGAGLGAFVDESQDGNGERE